jgi:hypothetical protein
MFKTLMKIISIFVTVHEHVRLPRPMNATLARNGAGASPTDGRGNRTQIRNGRRAQARNAGVADIFLPGEEARGPGDGCAAPARRAVHHAHAIHDSAFPHRNDRALRHDSRSCWRRGYGCTCPLERWGARWQCAASSVPSSGCGFFACAPARLNRQR